MASPQELDDVFCKVAEAIVDDDDIEKLGKEMRFTIPDITRYKRENMNFEINAAGTKSMIRKWAGGLKAEETLPKLRAALQKVRLVRIAEDVPLTDVPRGKKIGGRHKGAKSSPRQPSPSLDEDENDNEDEESEDDDGEGDSEEEVEEKQTPKKRKSKRAADHSQTISQRGSTINISGSNVSNVNIVGQQANTSSSVGGQRDTKAKRKVSGGESGRLPKRHKSKAASKKK